MNIRILVLSVTMLLVSCEKFESVEKKQIAACTKDIQLGLNDPGSFELISAQIIKEDKKLNRLDVNFTAKNKFGGRVRGEAVCGFMSATSAELDPNDYQNQSRELERTMSNIKG